MRSLSCPFVSGVSSRQRPHLQALYQSPYDVVWLQSVAYEFVVLFDVEPGTPRCIIQSALLVSLDAVTLKLFIALGFALLKLGFGLGVRASPNSERPLRQGP